MCGQSSVRSIFWESRGKSAAHCHPMRGSPHRLYMRVRFQISPRLLSSWTEVNKMRKAIQWTRSERIVRWSVFGGVLALAALTLWFAIQDESGPPELKAGADLPWLSSA